MSTSRTSYVILGVDLGGTKLAVGRLDERLTVLHKTITPTVTESSQACLNDLYKRLDDIVASGGAVDAIGVGTASMVDFAAGRIVESTNLPLADVALRDDLQARYGVPAVIDNDATVACIAEHTYGAGVGISDMLMLTVGTGIGGGIICNGRPYRGFSGAAGELGHIVIDVNGPRCQGGCPNYGCLEAFVSGNALAAHARRLAAARPGSAFGRAAAAGEPLDGRLVTRLAQAGDADAVAVYEELGILLGVGITSLVNAINPELVVVGGSVSAAGDLLLEPARRVLAERGLRPQRDEARIVTAHFASDSGLIGAAALALTELFGVS
jgi:glucokinase